MDNFCRREFLRFLGRSSALGLATPLLPLLSSCQSTTGSGRPPIPSVGPSRKDELLLSEGLKFHVLASWGDVINSHGDTFGTHNDFTTFVPRSGRANEGLLWVNHESFAPELIHHKPLEGSKSEIEKEQYSVGGSILHIKKDREAWSLQKNSKWNRRITGQTPIPFSQNTKILGSSKAYGTVANCSGGQTPWGTILTSEENYHLFYGDVEYSRGRRNYIPGNYFKWHKHFPLPPEHYGWVVEVNPWTGAAEKQVALGRARHEGSTVVETKKKRIVVYMGEDREGGFIYKFVSDGYDLKKGRLYAADTKNGHWLLLDRDKNPKLASEFPTQLDVLVYSSYAAQVAGATPQDRPEDIEIDPRTQNVLISLTNNKFKNNFHGGILKLSENEDFDSENFEVETWLTGGTKGGFSSPDNLAFDRNGNLWMTVDISEKTMGHPEYEPFGNNGLFYIPMSGEFAGQPIQVASAPVDAELTGPWFSPNSDTLFISVQHPGIGARKTPHKPTSHWPEGKASSVAKSSVIGIQGSLLKKLMS